MHKQQLDETLAKLKEIMGRLEDREKECLAKYEQNLVKARQVLSRSAFRLPFLYVSQRSLDNSPTAYLFPRQEL